VSDGGALDKFAFMKALRGADLTHAEYRVLTNLVTFARGDLTNARPGLDKLTEAACVTTRTAKLALRALVDKGWIELAEEGGNQHGKGKANVYALTIPKGVTHYPPSDDGKGVTDRSPSEPPRGSLSTGKGVDRRTGRGSIDDREGGHSVTPHQGTYQVNTSGIDHGGGPVIDVTHDRAREIEQEPPQPITATVTEGPAPAADPGGGAALEHLGWIEQELPQGFQTGERYRAKCLLTGGTDRAAVLDALLYARTRRARSSRFARSSAPALPAVGSGD